MVRCACGWKHGHDRGRGRDRGCVVHPAILIYPVYSHLHKCAGDATGDVDNAGYGDVLQSEIIKIG
jgi:hypothetical protein